MLWEWAGGYGEQGDDTAHQPAPTAPAAALDRLWEAEVDDAIAGLTAVRPRLSAPDPALALFDAQLKGLEALAGSPSLAAVTAKSALLGPESGDAIKRLLAQKAALDQKTTALENAAAAADRERIAAEARATEAAKQARLAESSRDLSRVAAGAIALGVLAFLLGHLIGIPKWAAAGTIGLGTLVATTAPQLLEFMGSDSAHHIMAATFGLLALGAVASLALWAYRRIKPAAHAPEPSTQKALQPLGPHEHVPAQKND